MQFYISIFGYDWTRDLHRLPFDGKIDYDKIIRKLAATKYDNVVMLEVHKDNGVDGLYDNMSNMEYLRQAKARADKLAEMIESYR